VARVLVEVLAAGFAAFAVGTGPMTDLEVLVFIFYSLDLVLYALANQNNKTDDRIIGFLPM
jgi:hypothetical protein